ncbi:uncharacterized protein LOC135076534 isoform X1 [Ostrinia nubilalis]|uniref:uncharacterized protein LOC135076534 isoform X1 n=1 Tax=Ostrinia nubilalis TaxID=29057 RepID=UPI0030826B76
MPWNRLPDVESCCGCVPDLKTAAAIIAVLGIVTSPAVSWAVVRHSYVIRVSCLITTSSERPDVVDVNLNNVLSFGFGANAGLGPTCLSLSKTPDSTPKPTMGPVFRSSESGPKFVKAVRYIGWIVLVSDLIFLFCSIYLLLRIFSGPCQKAAKIFLITAMIAMFLSFIYSMIYVSACITLGGAFPVFEFLFALFDLMKWTVWIHFLLVIRAYINSYSPLETLAQQDRGPCRWRCNFL